MDQTQLELLVAFLGWLIASVGLWWAYARANA